MEADCTADQPCQPRGDRCQVSSHAEGSQPGEPPAQETKDLPEVQHTPHTNISLNEQMNDG